MNRLTDQDYLVRDQYQDEANLRARIALHRRFSRNLTGWQRWVFAQFDIGPTARILELGCGPGDLWLENSDRIPANWDITLSDLSTGMLVQARANLMPTGHRFHFERNDAQAIPAGEGVFDAIIANHMLYHVPDLSQALGEIHRVLKPGGWFYAATGGETHMAGLEDLTIQFEPAVAGWFLRREVGFTLEQGGIQLEPWFDSVALRRYDDALVITEAEPLVAYLASMTTAPAALKQRLDEFTIFVGKRIADEGAIRIATSSGMFLARRQALA